MMTTLGSFELQTPLKCALSHLALFHCSTSGAHSVWDMKMNSLKALIEHDPTHIFVPFRPHQTLCQVVNSICMCMLVLDGVKAPKLNTADGE